MDAAFLNAVARRTKNREIGAPFTEERMSYVLKTGSNWAQPIGEFRLVVDKGDAANLVSFCGEGVKKISATRFEMRKSNWLPDSDLHVLILKPAPVQ